MPQSARILRVVLPVALIAVVMVTTLGMVCHHHGQCSAARCTLCHLAIDSPADGIGDCGLVPHSQAPLAYRESLISHLSVFDLSSRAPPA